MPALDPLHHAARIVAGVSPELPADLALREYFAEHVELPPETRRAVTRAVFSYFRWLQWLDLRDAWPRQIGQARALQERFNAGDKSLKIETLAALAVPAWLRDEMELPEGFLRQLQREPAVWLRARPGTAPKLAAALRDCAQADCSKSALPFPARTLDALRYAGARDLFQTPGFCDGAFEIQDLASQLVGHVCAPRPGETWWDACAGEGGKTLHLADLMQNRGLIWASDRSARRLTQLKKRAARAKIFNYRAAPWEGERLPTKTKFDGVLLDAPCSGVGTWQRNPHARWTTSPDDVRELAAIQLSLLRHAAPALKPGGRLIYSVCTLTRAETTAVADAFTAAHPEFAPSPVFTEADNAAALSSPACAAAEAGIFAESRATLWPQNLNANGMFIAVWKRK